MLVISVVGARPNILMLAPIARELARHAGVAHVTVHTGRHYDSEISHAFFTGLGIPDPLHHLDVASGSPTQQTAAVMLRLEPILSLARPDLVLVYGAVNSTAAAALVAARLGHRVGHVEAGLRSRDWTEPEEINRVIADRLSELLFAPSLDAVNTLRAEGVQEQRIHFVGNDGKAAQRIVAVCIGAMPREESLALRQS